MPPESSRQAQKLLLSLIGEVCAFLAARKIMFHSKSKNFSPNLPLIISILGKSWYHHGDNTRDKRAFTQDQTERGIIHAAITDITRNDVPPDIYRLASYQARHHYETRAGKPDRPGHLPGASLQHCQILFD